jgi:hypothetical protein
MKEVGEKYKYQRLCTIWSFHGGDYEEWCLLGCYTVYGVTSQKTQFLPKTC